MRKVDLALGGIGAIFIIVLTGLLELDRTCIRS